MNNEFLKDLDLELRHLKAELRYAKAHGENVQDLREEIANIHRLIAAEILPA